MKQILFFGSCLMLLMTLVACESDHTDSATDPPDVDVNNLPENLFVDFDPLDNKAIEQAKVYTADFITLDPDFVAEQLLQEKVIATEIYAQGPWFETEGDNRKEYLTVYDGGEALGIYSGVYGGMSYSLVENGVAVKYSNVATTLQPIPPTRSMQLHGYNLNSDYETLVDLDFLPYSEAEEEIKQIFSSIGISDIEVETVYALDEETMKIHYERKLEVMRDYGEEIPVLEWSKEDEAYLFFFRQVLDDIPLMNDNWQTGVREYVTETSISVLYNNRGINQLEASGIYDIMESSDEQPLLSGEEALNKVIEHYSSYILSSETTIETMELNYIGLADDDLYQLIPAWVFRVATVEEWGREDEQVQTYNDYSYYVINALSGQQMRRASETE